MIRSRSLRTLSLLAALVVTVAARGQDVDIQLERFGLDGAWRPGEFTPILVSVALAPDSAIGEARTVWVQWEVTNADGDVAEYGRTVALTRNQKRLIWLYAPLSPTADPGKTWPIVVYDYQDGERGQPLGATRISATPGVTPIEDGVIGFVASSLGTNLYALGGASRGRIWSAHENTKSISVSRIPDRWEGLRMLEALIFTMAGPNSDAPRPGTLTSGQVEALREWVRRGGHLVIPLPQDTNPWGLGEFDRSEFADILPPFSPERLSASLRELRELISKSAQLDGDGRRVGVRTFGNLDDIQGTVGNAYEPVWALPSGEIVVVQRTFGFGRITVIGIDLADLRMAKMANGLLATLPQPDAFWNRILGRRADVPTSSELMQLDGKKLLVPAEPPATKIGWGNIFRDQINMSGPASQGLLMALLLFVLYWVLAGPGGFLILKRLGMPQHAWVAFAGAAAVFTALAWGSVQLLRDNETRIKHVTVLDYVARPTSEGDARSTDPQVYRAATWASVYLPGYGRTSVGIESLDASPTERVPVRRDLLVSWTPPGETVQKFPNADRYAVDLSRDPDDFEMPARATVSQLYGHWLGVPEEGWGDMLRVDPLDPLRVEAGELRGSIVNKLPGNLEDVTIFWVTDKRTPRRRYQLVDNEESAHVSLNLTSHRMLNVGHMYGVPGGTLEAGKTYRGPWGVVGGRDSSTNMESGIEKEYVDEFRETFTANIDIDWEQFVKMLSIYQQLEPPQYFKNPTDKGNPERMVARRALGRELDLSPWFNRPCVIIIGFIRESASPIPFRVRGREVESNGTTIVRWIYPLPLDPQTVRLGGTQNKNEPKSR